MLDSIRESPLYPIANARGIASFGASNKISDMGSAQLSSLLSLGFEGAVYPIHPTETCVQNLKAYRSVLDMREIPDRAVIVLPRDIVYQTTKVCSKKGIKHVILFSSGFREVSEEGEEHIILGAWSYQLL